LYFPRLHKISPNYHYRRETNVARGRKTALDRTLKKLRRDQPSV